VIEDRNVGVVTHSSVREEFINEQVIETDSRDIDQDDIVI
jgi:hypothetical protein